MDEDIVISGISGRYPESDTIDEFRDNLFSHKDLVTEDARRWPPGLYGLPTRAGKIRDLSRFDAQFFGVNSKQANHLDPQLRLLLETTYEAIVDSGHNPECLRGQNIGVYIGESFNEFGDAIASDVVRIGSSSVTGTKRNMLANRLSYVFDLRGPSMVVDTACSSSLYALHIAFMAVKLGQIDMAIVGCANLNLRPGTALEFHKYNMLSKVGKCQFMDASADGYVRSESVSSLVLQRRSTAKRIYGTVINIRSNSDGYKAEGITYPSLKSQIQLMRNTLTETNVEAKDVKYVEAHGTGTQAGDVVEAKAIYEVYCRQRKDPILVGSVKSNIGHTESASGLSSIAKVLITFECNKIPSNIHYTKPNPKIPALMDGSIVPVLENKVFKDSVVAINSFGFGGSNVHLLLRPESRHVNHRCTDTPVPRLITFWGRTEASVEHVFNFIEKNSDKVNDDFLALINELTDNSEMHAMNYRGFMLYHNPLITHYIESEFENHRQIQEVVSDRRQVWFILSGMGTQWKHMAKGLMDLELFSQSIQNTGRHLESFGINLIELITSDKNNLMDSITGSSLAITAVQIALIDILRALDLRFDGMFGHSSGELTCAYVDGAIDAKQLIQATYIRGKCIEEHNLPASLMAAVGLSWPELSTRCPANVFPVCHNSQQSVTIAGLFAETQEFLTKLKSEKVFTRVVNSCGIGFHSPLMEPLKEMITTKLDSFIPKCKRSRNWLSSSVPEERWHTIDAKYSSAAYYVNNLLSPVLFEQCVRHIPNNSIVIEIAPDCLFRNIVRKTIGPDISYVGLMKRNNTSANNVAHLMTAIGALHNLGLNPKVQNLYPKVKFPVPRGTQSIGALIKWDHSDQWLVPLYPEYFNDKAQDVKNGWIGKPINGANVNGFHKKMNQNSNHSQNETKIDSKDYISIIDSILGIKKGAKVNRNSKLHELGMDSMMTSEVKEVLDKEFKKDFKTEYLLQMSYREVIEMKC